MLTASYARHVGRPLVPAGADAWWLYEQAPFGLLAHDTDPDPVFVYANRTAQRAFEYDWDEFTALPSRYSAEPVNRAERDQLIETVARDNYVAGYRGLRIAKSGRRFWIEEVTMWNLRHPDGGYAGQAAIFPRWTDQVAITT
nr:MEKHLA domain-containing protein [Kribbella sandramycini]